MVALLLQNSYLFHSLIYLFIWHSKHSMKIVRTQQCTKRDKKGYKEATNICPEKKLKYNTVFVNVNET